MLNLFEVMFENLETSYISTNFDVTAPYTGPKLQLDFTSSCAILNLDTPDEPNGNITHYKVCLDRTHPCVDVKVLIE